MKKYGDSNQHKKEKIDNKQENNKEDFKNEDTTLNDLDELYSKYIIDDIDFLSKSSNDDIDTKMNKMINIIKKGGNINNIINKEDIKEEQKKKEKIIEKSKKEDENVKMKQMDEKNEKEKKTEKKENEKLKEELKEELNNISSINTSSPYKKNNIIDKDKKLKISSKVKKLELLKKKEEKYLDIINL